MAEQLTNYQCPNCKAPLHFDPSIQKLKCDSCGSEFTIEQITAAFEEKNKEAVSIDDAKAQVKASSTLQWSEEEAKHLRAYNCPSCGAQLVTDETTAATSCPYCGNPTVVPAQFAGSLKPDYLIPFHYEKQQAVDALKGFYKGKPFLPSKFSAQNHIEEIKGLYVPFWLYDGTASGNLQYHATRVSSFSRGDDLITVTEHYQVGRQGNVTFDKIPADASSTMPDKLMDSIEPFDYNDLKQFELSYLPGFLANRYDVDSESDAGRADTRMKNTTVEALRSTIVGYASLMPQAENVAVEPGMVHYAFLPVWLLSTKYNGKNYLFAMNGQTGKMVSDDPPVAWGKFFLTFIIIAVVVGAAAWFLIGMMA